MSPVVCSSLSFSKGFSAECVCSWRCSGSGPCLALALPCTQTCQKSSVQEALPQHTASVFLEALPQHTAWSLHQSGRGAAVLAVVLGCVHLFVLLLLRRVSCCGTGSFSQRCLTYRAALHCSVECSCIFTCLLRKNAILTPSSPQNSSQLLYLLLSGVWEMSFQCPFL